MVVVEVEVGVEVVVEVVVVVVVEVEVAMMIEIIFRFVVMTAGLLGTMGLMALLTIKDS